MKRLFSTYPLLLLAFGILLTGCSKEVVIENGKTTVEEKESLVKLEMKMPGDATRALTTTQEETVHTVDILVFDSSDRFFDWRHGNLVTGGTVEAMLISSASTATSDKYRIVLVANARALLHSLFESSDGNINKPGGTTLNGRKGSSYDVVMALITTASPNPAPVATEGIPMWGELENKVTVAHGQNLGSLNLFRAYARIDVGTYSGTIPSGGVEAWSALDNFKLEEVRIYNAQANYRYSPLMTNFSFSDGGKITAPSLAGNTSTTTLACTDITAVGGVGVGVIRGLYMPDANVVMGGTYGDANHLNRPCVIVKGYYKPLGATVFNTVPSWYRIDFVQNNSRTLHNILRNYNYQVAITAVGGPGQVDADAALASMNADMTASILTWNSAGQGSTVIDGQYYLKVSDFDLKLEKWSTNDERFTVNTNVAAFGGVSWKAVVTGLNASDEANWLQLRNVNDGSIVSELNGADGDEIRFSVTEFPDLAPNNPRVGYIRMTAGNMKLDVRVEQNSDDTQFFLRLSNSEFIFDGRKLADAQGTSWSAPDAKTLYVNYGPTEFNYTLSLIPFSGGGITGFTPVSPSNAAEMDIQLNAIEPDSEEVAADPFYERSSKLNIVVRNSDNSATITKQVTIRQVYYSLLVTGTYDYYFQDKTYTFTLRSNTAWVANITGDDIFDPSVTPALSGSGSTATAGETFSFKIKSNATPGSSATVTFRSPDNLFPEQVYVINAQDALPNSYILAPSSTTDPIPVRKAYRVWKLDRDLKDLNSNGDLPSGAATVELLWQDAPGLISNISTLSGTGSAATFTVTAGSGSGNAVVAYKIGGTVYWSWHIWVTDETINSVTINGYSVMDRNLGALSATPQSGGNPRMMGLLYQGGRKDPFPPASAYSPASQSMKNIYPGTGSTALIHGVDGIVIEVAPPDVNLGPVIHNPMTIYRGTYGNTNWYGQFVDTRMTWNQTGRTDYDPCPEGWRTISSQVLSNVTAQTISNYSWLWNGTYFPAQGYYNYTTTTPTLINVGSRGYFWLVQSANIVSRGWSNNSVDAGSARVSNAVPVRCIRE